MKNDPVLVTGVGKRIGFHLADSLIDQGYPVLGTYRTERDDLKKLKAKGAELYCCDFSDTGQIQSMSESIKKNHSSLRAIIHNASDWLPDDTDYSADEVMRRMMQVHVSAPYQLNIALEPLLMASQHDHADIIHIGDYVSSKGSRKHIAYAASKAAQDNLTLSFAAKLAPRVKVNSLAPALIMFNPDDDLDYREKAMDKNLMKRVAGMEEIHSSINYLLNSHYVTGQILAVDGGRHLA